MTEIGIDNHQSESRTMTILREINALDQTIALEIQKNLTSIEGLVGEIVPKMASGGRLFYVGAGTSGRLGVLDASECPPTFGVDVDKVIGIIAGGDSALRNSVENAEDDSEQCRKDLSIYAVSPKDVVIGIAASGTTPYVLAGMNACKKHDIITGCISCTLDSPLAKGVDFPVEVDIGDEFIKGSTRMMAGTAQKLVLNSISTTIMVLLGKVMGDKMIDMKLSNDKLVERGTQMVMEFCDLPHDVSKKLLLEAGSVRGALEMRGAI